MQITRKSINSGIEHTLEIPAKPEDLAKWERGGGLIQEIMPYLSADHREFLMTGITPDEWNTMFPNRDKEDNKDDDKLG